MAGEALEHRRCPRDSRPRSWRGDEGRLLKAHGPSSPSSGPLGRAPGHRHSERGTQSYQEPPGGPDQSQWLLTTLVHSSLLVDSLPR